MVVIKIDSRDKNMNKDIFLVSANFLIWKINFYWLNTDAIINQLNSNDLFLFWFEIAYTSNYLFDSCGASMSNISGKKCLIVWTYRLCFQWYVHKMITLFKCLKSEFNRRPCFKKFEFKDNNKVDNNDNYDWRKILNRNCIVYIRMYVFE